MTSGAVKHDMLTSVVDYMLQIFMREGTTEYAPMVNFTITLQAHIALGVKERLANLDFPLPMSFIYGDHDWVQHIEEDIADIVLYHNKFFTEDQDAMGLGISKVHVIPTSDHNMHMDNPEALANTIINDIYNED